MSSSVLAVCLRPGVDPPWAPAVLSRKRALEQVTSWLPWFQDRSGARFRVFIYHLRDLWPTGSMVLDADLSPAPAEVAPRAVRTLWLVGLALKRGQPEASPVDLTRFREVSRELCEYLTEWQARVTGAGWPAAYREAFDRLLDLVRLCDETELRVTKHREAARAAARQLYSRLQAAGEEAVVTEEDPWAVLTPHIAALEIKRSCFTGELRTRYMPAVQVLQGLRPNRRTVSRTAAQDLRRTLALLEGFLTSSSSLNLSPDARTHELEQPEAMIQRLVTGLRVPAAVHGR